MNEAAAEHRGWEIEDDYRQHYMDDPNWDLAEDAESLDNKFIAFMIVVGVVVLGIYAIHLWLSPPIVKFPAMGQPLQTWPINQQWQAQCLAVDGKALTVQPNYHNPECQKKFMEARGAQ